MIQRVGREVRKIPRKRPMRIKVPNVANNRSTDGFVILSEGRESKDLLPSFRSTAKSPERSFDYALRAPLRMTYVSVIPASTVFQRFIHISSFTIRFIHPRRGFLHCQLSIVNCLHSSFPLFCIAPPQSKKSLAEFAASAAKRIQSIFCRGAPQGGFSCPFGAIHLLYLEENTSQAASAVRRAANLIEQLPVAIAP